MKRTVKGLHLWTNSSEEGPSYDPYQYDERSVWLNGTEYTLHLGLAEYLKRDGEIIAEFETAVAAFEWFTGMNPSQFDKYYAKIHGRCKECGNNKKFHWADGYPGETFKLCGKCGAIVDSEFDVSAVI